jgi:glycosyltransferase involved in cell wall biosynthesis
VDGSAGARYGLTRMLVTVVTPCFNGMPYIQDCLRSVHSQTHREIEHLVFDACSADGTVETIQESGLPVKLHVERDHGQADALNKGFAVAKGDVFCWMNADDYWLRQDVLERAAAFLRDHPEIDVVSAGGRYVDEQGKLLDRIPLHPSPVRVLRYYCPIIQPATFWRREAHRKMRADLSFAFDWRMFIDMAKAGTRFGIVDEEWAAYRVHPGSKTAQDSAARKREVASVLAEEWGALAPPRVWAGIIAGAYTYAEKARRPAVKQLAKRANDLIGRLTLQRVWSC